jgi:hypothetical protein
MIQFSHEKSIRQKSSTYKVEANTESRGAFAESISRLPFTLQLAIGMLQRHDKPFAVWHPLSKFSLEFTLHYNFTR